MKGNKTSVIIDEYEIVRQITKNDHSILYEAVSSKKEGGDLRYIIKEFLRNDSLEEMDKEIRLTQMLENHSKISVVIPVLRRLRKNNYLLMQFRNNGKFLSDLLNNAYDQPSDFHCIENAINLIEGVLTSLEVLHSYHDDEGCSGVLHLDIHPGNIFYESFVSMSEGETGVVKFIDFSNAHAVSGSSNAVQVITCSHPNPKGFTVFSAPEIVEQHYDEISYATDLFSVASLFFYLITRKFYTPESNLEKEIEEAGEKLALPSLMRFTLRRFLQCGLAYNPMYRYQSARYMVEELQIIRKILSYCKTCDYSKATSAAFDLLVPVDEVCRIPMKFKHSHFREAVNRLDKNLHINNVDIYRCKYQFQIFWTMAHKQWSIKFPAGELLANLLRSGILCCNNTGDHTLGDILRKDLEVYKEFLSVPEYLNLQLNLAEQENDKLEYIAASERVARTISCLEIIENAYKECSKIMGQGESSVKTKELGRTYSANGRYLSFLSAEYTERERDIKAEEAEIYFRKALDEFRDDTGNKEITICHILHLAVEYNNKSLYEEFAPLYFGTIVNNNVESCLNSILADEHFDVYKLFIFIKCINQFLPDTIDSNIMAVLVSFIDDSKKTGFSKSPFIPLIYRYIGCMLYKNAGSMTHDIKEVFVDSITYFDNTSFENTSPLNIITVMAYQTWAIYNELAGVEEDNLTLMDMLITQSRNNGWYTLTKLVQEGRPLTKILRYEYA